MSFRRTASLALCSALAAVLLSSVSFANATAASPLEGIWSFGGGAVAIQEDESGAFSGTVVQQTTFAVCPHPVGQVMWTAMKERPNGSFWGRHQWYRGAECALDSRPGLAAWRVMETTEGSKVLLVCLSEPGQRKQPKIAADGSIFDATYGCVESDPLASVPGQGGGISFDDLVGLPPAATAKSCRRSLLIVPRKLKYDPLKRLIVKFDGVKIADLKGSRRLSKRLVFENLPEGRFKVDVIAITVLEQRRTRSRVYRGCKGKLKVPGRRGRGLS